MSKIRQYYHLSNEYPNEAFVDHVVTSFVQNQGYTIEDRGRCDLFCSHSERGCWHIEFKGQTAAIRTDFQTGLGQIAMAWSPDTPCAIAIPATKAYLRLCHELPAAYRKHLNLHLLIVTWHEKVYHVAPDTPIPSDIEVAD